MHVREITDMREAASVDGWIRSVHDHRYRCRLDGPELPAADRWPAWVTDQRVRVLAAADAPAARPAVVLVATLEGHVLVLLGAPGRLADGAAAIAAWVEQVHGVRLWGKVENPLLREVVAGGRVKARGRRIEWSLR